MQFIKKDSSKKDDNSVTPDVNVNKTNWKNNENLKSSNPPRKKAPVLRDSVVKHVQGWRLNERMRSSIPIRSISRATTKAIKYHLKGCLEDFSPDVIILHHGAKDLKSNSTSKDIAIDVVNLALSLKNKKTTVYVSSLNC